MNEIKSLKNRKHDAKKIKDAIKKHKANKLKPEKLFKIVDECGIDPEFFTLAEQTDLTNFIESNKRFFDRKYAEGDNSTRKNGFLHSPYYTTKGKFFQFTIKPMIRKALQMSESWIKTKYDKDAYVYDDSRLIAINEFTKNYINESFQHRQYKLDIMHQIRHIVLFMAKEDVYYTAAFFDFINKFVAKYPMGFELTQDETYNRDMFHIGSFDEITERHQKIREQAKNEKY